MTTIKTKIPIIGFAAYSGTGKTTLLINIIPLLKIRGLEVGVIKHAHHTFEIDTPGKDSYELRKAGASQMLIGSKQRWALMVEQNEEDQQKRLEEYILHLDQEKLDLILVEGFKPEAIPKIELHRPSLGNPLISNSDESVIAIATDEPLNENTELTILDLNDHGMIVEYIINNICNKI
jgi:molybdopterin-guanine dinucleotide biosynthesis protein B